MLKVVNNYEEEFEYNIGKIHNFNEKNDMITTLDDMQNWDLVKFMKFLLNNSSYFLLLTEEEKI